MSNANSPPRPEELAWLVCPVCRSALAVDINNDVSDNANDGAKDDDTKGGGSVIRCSGCGRRYPIVDGIPILLAPRAS